MCSICPPENEHVNEKLRNLFVAVSKELSVEGILFQARYRYTGNGVLLQFKEMHACDVSDFIINFTREEFKLMK